jgi:hypothetical protein
MSTPSIRSAVLRRKNLLAASIVIAGGFVIPDASAATWTVNSCSDSITGSLANKTGTLRFAAQNAGSGDTIDLSQLQSTASCSTITLKTGAITFAQNSLILQGSASSPVAITGKYCTAFPSCTTEPDRIIKHTGTGTLDIYGMALDYGYLKSTNSTTLLGGCIYSSGNVILDHTTLTSCKLKAGTGAADGAGIFTTGTLSLISSTVSKGYASSASGFAFGGGIFAEGTTDVRYSTIRNNTAVVTGSATNGFGGGMLVEGSLYMLDSTVSDNEAEGNFGGVYVGQGSEATKAVTVRNSTISGNSAGNLVGGLFTTAHSVRLDNSTIAFNTAGIDRTGSSPNFRYYAPGVSLAATAANIAVTMQSTLIANNTTGSEYDLSVAKPSSFTITFSGSNNLVRATFAPVPAGTIKLSCPLLGPLRNNGGLVETHALLSHSPGIDQGNNVVALNYDERDSPYGRVSGSFADIGAYEIQQTDIVFNTSFESCPLLF